MVRFIQLNFYSVMQKTSQLLIKLLHNLLMMKKIMKVNKVLLNGLMLKDNKKLIIIAFRHLELTLK